MYSEIYKYSKSWPLHFNLLNAFEAAATEDASISGFGNETLKSQNCGWMLFRLALNVSKDFRLSEFEVTTWPSGHERLFVYRDYELRQNGAVVGGGSTTWLMVNLATKKPILSTEIKSELEKNESPPSWELTQSPQGEGKLLNKESFIISQDHLDENLHLNNKWYVSFALDSLPTTTSLKRLVIQFNREVHAGDTLVCRTERIAKDKLLHKLGSAALGKNVATISSLWHHNI